uniref:Bombinin n=1 Tax=Bombina variegata TaxID=8348 RepID=BMN_BOMVA|nr:RecName: Full=Bombinin [Bombina variegata]
GIGALSAKGALKGLAKGLAEHFAN